MDKRPLPNPLPTGIRWMDSCERLWEIDWRDVELAMSRDPDGRTMPNPNRNQLLLTAEDYVLLWEHGIGTA